MTPKPYTSKDLARDVVKKRTPDDRAVGGQAATDYTKGYLRGSKDRIGTTTGQKGSTMPKTGWTGQFGKPGSFHRHDANVTNGPGEVPRYKKPV